MLRFVVLVDICFRIYVGYFVFWLLLFVVLLFGICWFIVLWLLGWFALCFVDLSVCLLYLYFRYNSVVDFISLLGICC